MGNRKLPFGYQMRMGEIIWNEPEAKAVQDIFLQYTLGASLKEIAEQMSKTGPAYDEGKSWNKNMIARILENTKYTGTDIVDIEVLHGDNAFVSDLQIVLLFDGLVFLLFLLAFGVGVDLSDIFQNDLCHNREPQSCRLRDAGPRSRLSAPLYGRSPHCRTAGSAENVPPFVFPASGT